MDKLMQAEIALEFEQFLAEAEQVSGDIVKEVQEILREGREKPLTSDEAHQLLTRVVTVVKNASQKAGDTVALARLGHRVDEVVNKILKVRESSVESTIESPSIRQTLPLIARNGISVGPVQPKPYFHGIEVAMKGGFVKTSDINLWDSNERLEIHLGQFRQKNGRKPNSTELLDIMLSKMNLPGISGDDQFKIIELARSIAVNGVRKPPIIDIDGTLLDGNRRVAACRYILSSDDFETEHKKRVEYIYVWQLTEYATDDERDAVVVSLNFEADCKQDWPEYVKARKVFEEWEQTLALEPRTPALKRQAEMKKELSMKFALGPDSAVVNRYLKMVDWANDFEDHHVAARGKDTYEVKHRSAKYFQYFDELAKGTRPGGVAYTMTQNDGFKELVFDLLYEGKFRSWRDIRALRFIYENSEAKEIFSKARNEIDIDMAQDHVENAIAVATTARAEAREVGANTRIESFVKWLEELPVRAFRDSITRDNLSRLLSALKLVEKQAETIPADKAAGEA
jgi:hypothetical protein